MERVDLPVRGFRRGIGARVDVVLHAVADVVETLATVRGHVVHGAVGAVAPLQTRLRYTLYGLRSAERAWPGQTYNDRLNTLLVARFGATPLDELGGDALGQLDAELAREKLTPSTRRNLQIVFRSVLRCSVDAGLLAAMPILPRLPRVGREIMRPMHGDDLRVLLASASESARVALLLAAYAGLRASEVRGLRWTDVDLKGGSLTVRRAITPSSAGAEPNRDLQAWPSGTFAWPRSRAAACSRQLSAS